MNEPTLFDRCRPRPGRRAGARPLRPLFDGHTFDHRRDAVRLTGQLLRTMLAVSDGRWRTPEELSAAVGADWSSVNARLRDLRKAKFGGFRVERRSVGGGLFQYRLHPGDIDQVRAIADSAKSGAGEQPRKAC